MNSPTPVLLPLINPNEPEALLAAVQVSEGQHVAKGDPLCTLETTKSTAEVAAETEGYVAGLRFAAGETVRAGDTLCYLAPEPGWQPPPEKQPGPAGAQEAAPEGLRITQPALALARQAGLDLSRLPFDRLVTEEMVRAFLPKAAAPLAEFSLPETAFDPTAILVYGGGGHGKSLIDLLRSLGVYRIVGVVDDGMSPGEQVMGLLVLGGARALSELHAQGVRLAVNAVGGIGNIAVRIQVFRRLAEAGFTCPAVAHPSAVVEPSAVLSPGAQVFPHAYVGSETRLGYGAIANTGAIISHDCVVGDYANISPGAMLAGEVQVGSGALVGMGVTVNLGARIGAGARIGNGATVKADVPERGVVRAGSVWPE